IAVDPRDPSTLYVGTKKGLLRSEDGGASWMLSAQGLDIPFVTHVMAPAASGSIFVGTYAGLYRSDDGGRTFRDGNLRLQFEKNTRREIGGAAYIDAYWLGRYYGFIDEATANAPPDAWK
ncbi:MAG: WD40/YVTN/BNR-like repeat-containing protein, partial [Armatimonadota bacterium]